MSCLTSTCTIDADLKKCCKTCAAGRYLNNNVCNACEIGQYSPAGAATCSPSCPAGFGADVTIHELAKYVVNTVGYEGEIIFNLNKPDGIFSKLMDSSLIESLGWKASVGLEDGLAITYADYLKHKSLLRSD